MSTTIAPLAPSDAGLFVRFFYWLVRKRLGRVPAPIGVTAHNKRVLTAYALFEYAMEGKGALDPGLKALANLKAAMEVGCRFCVDIGSAHAAGLVTPQQLEALVTLNGDVFNQDEQDVLRLVVEMSATPAAIDAELIRRLEDSLGTKALVELTSVIAWENYRARFNHAFGATEEGFSEASCMLPALADA